jgi:hypothetical protein
MAAAPGNIIGHEFTGVASIALGFSEGGELKRQTGFTSNLALSDLQRRQLFTPLWRLPRSLTESALARDDSQLLGNFCAQLK